MQIRYTLGKESNLSFKIYADKFNVCFFINLVLTIINQKKKKMPYTCKRLENILAEMN